MKVYRGSFAALRTRVTTDIERLPPPTHVRRNEYVPRYISQPQWWARRALTRPVRNGDDIVFMHTDTTYSSPSGRRAVVELHGCTEDGHSVMVNVHNYLPNFYVRVPRDVVTQPLDVLMDALEHKLSERMKNNKKYGQRTKYVERWEEVEREDILHYKGPRDTLDLRCIKVYLNHPKQVPEARTILEQGRLGCKLVTYEANVRYDIRSMIDMHIHGCQWIRVRDVRVPCDPMSRAQVEVDVEAADIEPLQRESIAPIRVLSYDIECVTFDGERRFPDASCDPVISIGCHLYEQGQPARGCVFCLVPSARDSVADLGNGIERYVFSDERDLFHNWRRFLLIVDADLLTGYNINGFDNPYLEKRARALNVYDHYNGYRDLSRITGRPCKNVVSHIKSKAYGTRTSELLSLPGRITFDLYDFLQRTEKLRSYGLNAVAEHFLKDKKEDVPYFMIHRLYHGTDDDRARINRYCYKDARLPVDIILRRRIIINNVQMVRVTGVPYKWLLERGQQAKTQSLLLRETQVQCYVVPTKSPPRTDFTGAVVIEPERGYYDVPINTLDFASLYPSIMQAFNLCYTTFCLIRVAKALGLKEGDDYFVPPIAFDRDEEPFCFVKPHIRKGLLPQILARLLGERKAAKRAMFAAEDAGDTELQGLMDGLQLALKLSANSVYGFTSANMLCLTAISKTVTGCGRDMLYFTRDTIVARYNTRTPDLKRCIRAGIDPNWHKAPRIYFEADSRIIYGDTDSVMVWLGDISMERAQELGREISAYMKPLYKAPNDLEWEKTYYPYLLISKKRYAALLWTKPTHYDKMDCKGIETVRRDWTLLCTMTTKRLLQQVLVERDPEGAVHTVHEVCEKLLRNQVDMSQLILSKGYSKPMAEYEAGGKTVPVHIQVVKNMTARDPATAPRIGDRVPYVMVTGLKKERGAKGWKKTKTSEHAEDPYYAIQNDVPLDGMWYIMNQLVKPCIRIMQPVLCKDPYELADADGFYKKHPENTVAYKRLFVGAHMNTRTITIRKAERGLITGWVTSQLTCLNCKTSIREQAATCTQPSCVEAGKTTLVQRYRAQFDGAKDAEAACKQTCVDCQDGMAYEDILCENKTCANWYQRYKTSKHVEDLTKTMARFDF